MARIIKFRSWITDDYDNGQIKSPYMSEPFDLEDFADDQDNEYGEGRLKTDNLMQFTGLLDKNGQEIYEGDIINWNDQKAEVTYEGMAFIFKGLEPFHNHYVEHSIDTITNPDKKQLIEAEVIGNIYENPNLVEEGQDGK